MTHKTLPPAAVAIALLSSLAAGRAMAAVSPTVSEYWESEYKRLADRKAAAGANSVPLLKDGKPILKGRPSFPYHNNHCMTWCSDRDPADIVLRRTRALLGHVVSLRGDNKLADMGKQLAALEARGRSVKLDSPDRKTLFLEVCRLRRTIAMSNPLLNFDKIIFSACGMGIGVATNPRVQRGSHWQYMGFQSMTMKGEGLIVLSDWKSGKPRIRNVFSKSQRAKRRFHSAFDLSYDAKDAVYAAQTFSKIDTPWPIKKTRGYDLGDGPTHVFKVRLDGSDPIKLTGKGYSNGFPAWLPGGRIVYVCDYAPNADGSGWNRKADRCGGWATTLWSMKADGSDAYAISWHESAEYHPVVDYDGRIVYSRWDYLDRNWDSAHHLWTCYPDGRDPRAPHGNYPYPHHRLENGPKSGVRGDGRAARPWAEIHIRPIPGSPGKYVAIAGGHHRVLPGAPVLIDTNIEDDHMMSQVRIIAGTDLPHEGRGVVRYKAQDEYFTPWPLSEDYYLITNRNRILLIDKFGNELLICNWDNKRGVPVSPRPLRPRRRETVIPTRTHQGARRGGAGHKRATILVTDVYNSADKWPEGTKIKSIRILQYIPRPFRHTALHVQKRVVLGTVPVESDGSAYFEAPIERLIYFQALDADGLAVQSMRSGTYVHPGEQLTCNGCHERKGDAPARLAQTPLAVKRAPSPIAPEVSGSNPMSYRKLVHDTVFQTKCLPCHKKKNKGLQDFTFDGIDEWHYDKKPSGPLVGYLWRSRSRDGFYDKPHGAHRFIPGRFGARESKLGKLMLGSHRKRINKEEFHRVMLWLDANTVVSSAYLDGRTDPLLEYDPENRTGVEKDRPAATEGPPREVYKKDLYTCGAEGYKAYRIPALVVTNNGVLLAFCEGRKDNIRDHGDIDLVLRRSRDSGKTWSDQVIVHEEGGAEKITIGNPCPVVDRSTGVIWLAFCRNNRRVFMTRSSDDGKTWAKPTEITASVKKEAWGWYATGPGHGIQLTRGKHKGRLVFPCDHGEGKIGRSHVFYSDDHGKTFVLGQPTDEKMNECEVAELADGRLLLTMRNGLGKLRRAFSISKDGGVTWSKPKVNDQVYCPVCQASIHRYSWKPNILLHSGPGGPDRRNLTVRASFDEGETWPAAKVIDLQGSGYSDLAVLPDGSICCLFESGWKKPIVFARFSLKSLTAKR